MRFIILFLLLGLANLARSQEKVCPFPIDSVILLDSLSALPLLDSLKSQQEFETFDNVEDVPKFVMQTLACWRGEFEMVNRTRHRQILLFDLVLAPARHGARLMYLAVSKNYLIMAYERGICYAMPHLVIFKLENTTIRNCWHGLGGNPESMEQLFWSLKHCSQAINFPSDFRTSF
jgi:hypothetical protein